jgi:hypothetical protein
MHVKKAPKEFAGQKSVLISVVPMLKALYNKPQENFPSRMQILLRVRQRDLT